MNCNKLALGTVQFGLDYGINNTSGKIAETEVCEILNYASQSGIQMLDTAAAYGESEKVLGKALKETALGFDIISKYPANQSIRPEDFIDTTLHLLNIPSLYAYLFHNYQIFNEHPDYIDDLVKIREQKKAKKIGFSLYYPAEAEYILDNNIPCDIVQVPFNFFDQRFSTLFPKMKEKGIEIHVRSIFLQGLFFKDVNKLDTQFYSVAEKIAYLHSCAAKHTTSISSLCMEFANNCPYIDKIVFGVDSLVNLKENINAYNFIQSKNIEYGELTELAVSDENIILPFKWKK